ncbi:MAG TPA: hypothetical protein VIH75_25845 [Candidatus Sulfotelmatobacter sp.]
MNRNLTPDNDTNRMDEVLKRALRREQAPDGFADRILARASEVPLAARSSAAEPIHAGSWLRFFTRPLLRWATLTALATAMLLGVHLHSARRERARGEAAKQRLMLALRIAGSKLQLAKSRVNEINAGQSEKPEDKE